MAVPVSAFDEANAGEATLQVGPGFLFLFPARLVHTVPQNRTNEERISVSFNIMLKDYSSTMSNPLWTANRWPGAD